jgi:2-polyprenyl-3-methyl-5-hydroxy-6-metoxy-1,4-benzoquinol methylase
MTYIKEVFDVTTLAGAKNTVLTDDPTNPDKFTNETNFLVDMIAEQNIINSDSVVLDFGCGMGRVSKKLIDTFDCKIIGTDISNSMMRLANIYVNKPSKFKTMNSYNTPNSIDVCISAFVLQHVQNPKMEIESICSNLKPGGYLVLVNEHNRFVPSDVDANRYVIWKDDGFDIFGEIETRLMKVKSVQYMTSLVDVIFYRKSV